MSEKGRASWPRFGRKAASWAFFVFFVLCFLVYPDGVFDSFQAADADDYLRLVRAREWLAGRGWFDDVIPRLGPGGGTAIPWSRLVDVPLAFAARLLFWLGVQAPWEKAALITPLFLCALLVPLGRTMARPFVPRAYAWLGPVVFFSCVSPFLFHFSPTRVDHNAFYLLLAGVGFAAVLRIVLCPRSLAPPFIAAGGGALSLWVGGESFFFLIPLGLWLALMAAWRGGRTMEKAAHFGAFFGVLTAALLPLARPAAAWGRHDLAWFSGASVLFALLSGAVFVFLWERGQSKTRRQRLFLAIAGTALCGGLFLLLVPEAGQDPTAAMGEASGQQIWGHMSETRPLGAVLSSYFARSWRAGALVAAALIAPLLAACAVLFQKQSRRKRLALLPLGLTLLFLLGALVWQRRLLPYVQLFSLPLVVQLLSWGLKKRQHVVLKALFVLSVTFFPSVLLPSWLAARPFLPDTLFFYAARQKKPCSIKPVADFLGRADGWGRAPLTLANMISDGPALLFFTPHHVLSAPYDVASNGAVKELFSASNDAQSRVLAAEMKVDLLVLCRRFPKAYASVDRSRPSLAERLVLGEIPAWLKPVEIEGQTDYLLFKVEKDET